MAPYIFVQYIFMLYVFEPYIFVQYIFMLYVFEPYIFAQYIFMLYVFEPYISMPKALEKLCVAVHFRAIHFHWLFLCSHVQRNI